MGIFQSMQPPSAQRSYRGFTIVEILVVIVVITVVLSLTLVGLARVKKTAWAARCLTHERECSTVIDVYSGDHRGFYPRAGTLYDNRSFFNGGWAAYTANCRLWTIAAPLARPREALPAQFCSARPRLSADGDTVPFLVDQAGATVDQGSDFFLTMAAIFDPRVFSGEVRGTFREDARAVGVAEVRYPSRKGILAELTPIHVGANMSWNVSTRLEPNTPPPSLNVAFADGSCAIMPASQVLPGVRRNSDQAGTPVLSTRDGIRGVDVVGR